MKAVMIIDSGSSSSNTCSYEGTDLSCSEIIDCTNSCSPQACLDKSSDEGRFRYNAAIQCLVDNCLEVAGDNEAFTECQNTNCMTELQMCGLM